MVSKASSSQFPLLGQLTLLLLVLCKQRHKECQILSNPPLLEVRLKLRLQAIVQGGELRTNVESTSLPVCLGGEFRGQLRVLVEGDVLDAEYTRVGLGVDGEGALVCLGGYGWESGVGQDGGSSLTD